MKFIFTLCCFCLPFLVAAQRHTTQTTFLTSDSLSNTLTENWKYHEGDFPQMAEPNYDDSKWAAADPSLRFHQDSEYRKYTGIGWFRLHLYIDTSITDIPLALQISHYGASEIYVDGRKIATFGKINGKDSTKYYDPQYLPFVVPLHAAGAHLIAVRYANYKALSNHSTYRSDMAGFRMVIGKAEAVIYGHFWNRIALGFVLILLFGIFITLSFLHLLLYVFYRAARSNLYYSIFTLSLGVGFLILYLGKITTAPLTEFRINIIGIFLVAAACLALSGVSNELFARKKIRFRIIIVFSVIMPVLWFLNIPTGLIAFLVLVVLVTLEAIILTVAAIYKKVQGARIIGTGILFFTLFIVAIFILSIITRSLNFDDSTVSGQLLEFIGAIAILSIPISMSVYQAWSFATVNKNLEGKLQQVKLLSDQAREQEQEKQRLLETRQEELEKEVAIRTVEVRSQKDKIEKQHEALKEAKRKSDDLLRNILPEEVAEELKENGTSEAHYYDHVTVLFTDFVDFTRAGEKMTPQELVDELHNCFKEFDEIISRYNIEKIKTIGDAYLAVCGLPVVDDLHALNIVNAAIEIKEFMAARKLQQGITTFDIRIGINSGSVIAGIVGVKKFAYDIWGDTVNTAARMEQNSEAGKINISQSTHELVKDHFVCTYRGEIAAKNKGALQMYFIEERAKTDQ